MLNLQEKYEPDNNNNNKGGTDEVFCRRKSNNQENIGKKIIEARSSKKWMDEVRSAVEMRELTILGAYTRQITQDAE